MDHVTDQLELLNARLPARGSVPGARDAATWSGAAGRSEDSDVLQDCVLRGTLELQNVQLASQYASILPQHQQAGFLSEFAHFFGNPSTAPQAFRLALSLLPVSAVPPAEPAQPAYMHRAAEAAEPAYMRHAAAVSRSYDLSCTEDSEGEAGFAVFKDDIYRDVALFITANEDRPQFLQDLFGLLQGCASDYVRQRCINALEDVMGSVLSDAPSGSAPRSVPRPAGPSGLTAAGLNASGISTVKRVSRPGTASSGPGSAIRTHRSVAAPVGYDYGEPAADVRSVPTADGSSVASSMATDDPVFGKDPLTETMVFQGGEVRGAQPSAPAGSKAVGGFDTLLAHLDESLRRSALEDRSQYPEELLQTESEDGTRTESTMDTSADDLARETDADVVLVDALHKYLGTLPGNALLDATIVDAFMRVLQATVPRVLPAHVAAIADDISRYIDQPLASVGALTAARIVEVLGQLSGVSAADVVLTAPDASDAEMDNRRDDAAAAAGQLPEAPVGASDAASDAATAGDAGDATSATATPGTTATATPSAATPVAEPGSA